MKPPRGPQASTVCSCGHHHIVSIGDGWADAGCEAMSTGCGCWTWRPAFCSKDDCGRQALDWVIVDGATFAMCAQHARQVRT